MTTDLYTLPIPSTGLTREAFFSTDRGRFAIRFGYVREGKEVLVEIAFSNVAAARVRSERCCKLEQIELSYDVLVELEASPWVTEVRSDMQEQWRDKWQMRHFMIYFDSVGCFELIADSWEILTEELTPPHDE